MHEIEKCKRVTVTSTVKENLRPVRRTRRHVGNRFSRSIPESNSFTHILRAIDVFSRYLFAVLLRRPDTQSVVKRLLSIFVPKHILTDKGTAFSAELMTELAVAAGIHISHATIKHAQTIGVVERSHAKVKKRFLNLVSTQTDHNGTAMST